MNRRRPGNGGDEQNDQRDQPPASGKRVNPAPKFVTRDQGESTGRQTGRVVRLVREKGFGFIKGTDGLEYFFHHSGTTIYDLLTEGDVVTFNGMNTLKGPRATGVARD
jgi:cold shock CspA family protein